MTGYEPAAYTVVVLNGKAQPVWRSGVYRDVCVVDAVLEAGQDIQQQAAPTPEPDA